MNSIKCSKTLFLGVLMGMTNDNKIDMEGDQFGDQKIGEGNRMTRPKPSQCHFLHAHQIIEGWPKWKRTIKMFWTKGCGK